MSVWTSHETGLPPLASGGSDVFVRALSRFAFKARMVLALTGGLIASLVVLLILSPEPPHAPVVNDLGIGAWTRKAEASPRLTIRSAAFAGLPQSAALWTRARGNVTETEDRLIAGDVEANGPFLLVAAARPAADAGDTSLFVASARLAANEGLSVSRFAPAAGQPPTAWRFAPLETARVTLAKVFPSAPARESCLAWRAPAGSGIVLSGLACPASGEAFSDEQFDCLLRDLAAMPAADAQLRDALAPVAAPMACRRTSLSSGKTARKG